MDRLTFGIAVNASRLKTERFDEEVMCCRDNHRDNNNTGSQKICRAEKRCECHILNVANVSLNFIYAHLNRVIKARDLNMIYISGPGHAGAGIVADAPLD